MTTSPPAVHRTIVCAEIQGFGGRNDRDLLAIRGAFHDALRAALTRSTVSWSRCKLEDRGDGVVLLAPPDVPKIHFTDGFPRRLVQVIDEHNRTCAPSRRFRVRLAIHAGEISHDEHGVGGLSVSHAFRLLDADRMSRSDADLPAGLTVILSDWVFDEIVRSCPDFEPNAYAEVAASVGGTDVQAWILPLHVHATREHPPVDKPPDLPAVDEEEPGLGTRSEERHAFDEFYLANSAFVRNVLHVRADDWTLAAEVTDEAMAIAYRKWDELAEHPNPVAFVVVTARRILSKIQRRLVRTAPPLPPLSLDAVPGPAPDVGGGDPADTVIGRTVLDQALRALPPDQRECFVLHEILDRPVREIAELLAIPEGTVKTRLRTARLSLRDLLGEGGL